MDRGNAKMMGVGPGHINMYRLIADAEGVGDQVIFTGRQDRAIEFYAGACR